MNPDEDGANGSAAAKKSSSNGKSSKVSERWSALDRLDIFLDTSRLTLWVLRHGFFPKYEVDLKVFVTN